VLLRDVISFIAPHLTCAANEPIKSPTQLPPVNAVRPTSYRALQARSQPSDNEGSFSSDVGPFLGFGNWSSQWLSRGDLDF